MFLFDMLFIISQCLSVMTTNAIDQTLQGVEIGVHTPTLNESQQHKTGEFEVFFIKAFNSTPKVMVWVIEVSEEGEGTQKILFCATFKNTSLLSFVYTIYLESTTFESFSTWFSGKQDIKINKFLKQVLEPPSVLVFLTSLQTITKKRKIIATYLSKITVESISLKPQIDSTYQIAYFVILAISKSQIHGPVSGYLTTDNYTHTDWITNATSIPKTFRYPVNSEDNILRGFYAFNQQLYNYSANISASFTSGQKSGKLEITIPNAGPLPIEGFKFMAAQLAFINCPPNSTFVAPSCECSEGYYDAITECKKCPSDSCTSCLYKNCQICKTGTIGLIITKNKCECGPGYFNNQTECSKCSPNCKKCSNNLTCSQCYDDMNRQLVELNCICQPGFYEQDTTCLKCQPICLSCSDNTTCLMCNVYRNSSQNCECKQGFTEDDKQQCVRNTNDSISGIIDLTCDYPCQLCSKFSYNCTSCDTYHTLTSSNQCFCKPPLIENMNLKQCQQDQRIDARIIGAFDGINEKLKGNGSLAVTMYQMFINFRNLGIPIGIFALITKSPQFLLLDLFIKQVHPLKVYKSFETLSRFMLPIYIPDVQGQHYQTSLILFGSYNATQYAYRYGQPLNETYMNTLGFSPYSILICSQYLIILLIYLLICLLTLLLMRYTKMQKSLIMVSNLNYRLFHITIESGTLFLAVQSFYTLFNINEYKNVELVPLFIVSILTSLLLLGSYIGYQLYVVYSIIAAHKRGNQDLLQKRFPFFFNQVRTHKVASSLFKVTSQFKKLVFAFIVICFHTLQSYIALISLQSMFTVYMLLVMPQQYITIFVLDLSLQVLYIVYLAFSLSDHLQEDQGPAGDGAFCLILCILLVNLMENVGKLIAGYEVNKVQQKPREAQQMDQLNEEVSRMFPHQQVLPTTTYC